MGGKSELYSILHTGEILCLYYPTSCLNGKPHSTPVTAANKTHKTAVILKIKRKFKN